MTDISRRSESFKAKIKTGGCYVKIDDLFIHESEALSREMLLIERYGRKDQGGTLLNKTDGGELPGWLSSEERNAAVTAAIERALAEYKKVRNIDNDDTARMLRIEKVLDLIPVSRVSLYRMIKAGQFPAPIKAHGISLWPNHEIRKWRDNLLASRKFASSIVERKRRRDMDDLV